MLWFFPVRPESSGPFPTWMPKIPNYRHPGSILNRNPSSIITKVTSTGSSQTLKSCFFFGQEAHDVLICSYSFEPENTEFLNKLYRLVGNWEVTSLSVFLFFYRHSLVPVSLL